VPFHEIPIDLWLAAEAGLVGAAFSIALAIKSKTVALDTEPLANATDGVLRLSIGVICAGVLVLLVNCNILRLTVGMPSKICLILRSVRRARLEGRTDTGLGLEIAGVGLPDVRQEDLRQLAPLVLFLAQRQRKPLAISLPHDRVDRPSMRTQSGKSDYSAYGSPGFRTKSQG
jgi:hypothetical protein